MESARRLFKVIAKRIDEDKESKNDPANWNCNANG
jgi:hypothetical protein